MTLDPLVAPMNIGGHVVPGIWRFILPYEFGQLEIPTERRATCLDCPRTYSDDYRPDYRCCTYHPRVPNFLLGLALTHKTAGKAVRKVAKLGWVLPEGMQASPQQWATFLADVGEERFGKSTDVLCPFLEKKTGFCGIYHFRNSVCSTFFCLHDHGDPGEKFWDALQNLVVQVELALGQWALREMGFDFERYIETMNGLARKVGQVADRESLLWTSAVRKKIWGRYFGKELEVCRKAADLVSRHRDDLWEIANEQEILEATTFEKSTHSIVPKRYQNEIEDDYSEEGETLRPRKLWEDVERKYYKLWKIPDRRLQLSPRAVLTGATALVENVPRQAPPQRSQATLVQYLKRRGGRTEEWHQYVDRNEAKALQFFSNPTIVNASTAKEISKILKKKPDRFIAEWVAKKYWCRYHADQCKSNFRVP